MALVPEILARGFVNQYGYPEAIVSDCNRALYRTRSGDYFVLTGDQPSFVQISREEGARAEKQFTSHTPEAVSKCLPQGRRKGEPTQPESFPAECNQIVADWFTALPVCKYEDPGKILFAGLQYLKGSKSVRVAYNDNQYFLKQGTDECLSASLLNANIFAGLNITPDQQFLHRMHAKVAKLAAPFKDKGDVKIDMDHLQKAVDKGLIPGLEMKMLEDKDIDTALAQKEPLIATQHSGHAVTLVGKTDIEGMYTVIDTLNAGQRSLVHVSGADIFRLKITSLEAFTKWVLEPQQN